MGSFSDVLELPDGSLGYIIGDVCGHGATAAALGSAIRAGWKTIAHHAPRDPQAWARSLDISFFGHGRRRDEYVTANTGRIDATGTNLVYVSAGHPWPVLVDANTQMLAPIANRPLGIRPGEPYGCSRAMLSRNSTLLLFTDGLYEGRSDPGSAWRNDRDVVDYLQACEGPLDLDASARALHDTRKPRRRRSPRDHDHRARSNLAAAAARLGNSDSAVQELEDLLLFVVDSTLRAPQLASIGGDEHRRWLRPDLEWAPRFERVVPKHRVVPTSR